MSSSIQITFQPSTNNRSLESSPAENHNNHTGVVINHIILSSESNSAGPSIPGDHDYVSQTANSADTSTLASQVSASSTVASQSSISSTANEDESTSLSRLLSNLCTTRCLMHAGFAFLTVVFMTVSIVQGIESQSGKGAESNEKTLGAFLCAGATVVCVGLWLGCAKCNGRLNSDTF